MLSKPVAKTPAPLTCVMWRDGRLRHERYDEKADIWSFACVCESLSTHKQPYSSHPRQDGGAQRAVLLVASGELRPSLPAGTIFADLVAWCAEPSPEDRPTFQEISNYLARADMRQVAEAVDRCGTATQPSEPLPSNGCEAACNSEFNKDSSKKDSSKKDSSKKDSSKKDSSNKANAEPRWARLREFGRPPRSAAASRKSRPSVVSARTISDGRASENAMEPAEAGLENPRPHRAGGAEHGARWRFLSPSLTWL